jgi:spore maturation protein CgeB
MDKTHYEPLRQIFTRVVRYDFLKGYVEMGVKAVNQEILELVRAERPKYVLWPSYMYEIQESTFQHIRDEGTIVIGWFWDDHTRFDDYSKWWIPYVDYFITDDDLSVPKYEQLGARCLLAPMACNPDLYPRLDLPTQYDVSFVGANISNREKLLSALKERGIAVHIFGKGWGEGYVSFDKMINIFNASKINLNFAGVSDYGVKQLKGRVFEIPMCGGFELTEYVPGIEEYFEIDGEIVCFENIDEAADKIEYYLSHETERERIAQAGYERAHRDHTWSKRLSEVFQEIEKDAGNRVYRVKPSPEVLEMPQSIRRQASTFHLNWARALLLEGYKNRWRDELDLALAYDPSNREARYLYLIGPLPSFIRPCFFRLYSVLSRINQMLRSGLHRLVG